MASGKNAPMQDISTADHTTSLDIATMDHPSEVIVAYRRQRQRVPPAVDRNRGADWQKFKVL